MITPDEFLHVQQERIAALEIALRGCLQQMEDVDLGRRSSERWAMAYKLGKQVLKQPEVIY